MPLLTDEQKIAELRTQFPSLTHTSWKELDKIEPRPNVDKHQKDMGEVVFATSSDSDFYALCCHEQKGMINFSFPYCDADGKMNRIFIFEKMKDAYYEHVVSSENFTPIVSETGVFSGEWVSHDEVTPITVKVGNKEEILKTTPAKVFTISDMERFKEKMNNDSFVEMIKDAKMSLDAVTDLVNDGILKGENKSGSLRSFLSKHAERQSEVSLNDTSKKKELSSVQQAMLKVKQSHIKK